MRKFRISIIISIFIVNIGSHGYCQNAPKISLWLGYERLIPFDKTSDIFKSKKNRPETEIKTGNGINSFLYFNTNSKFTPFIKAAYIWHRTLKQDTLINAINYTKEISYSTIPFSIGTNFNVYSAPKTRVSLFLDINYNLMSRNMSIKDIGQHSSEKRYNFGYSIGFNPTIIINNNIKLNLYIGLSKKGNYTFTFSSISLPIMPSSYFSK